MIRLVRVRRGYLALVVAVVAGGGLLVGAPAQSQAPVASILAKDNAFQSADGGAANITVAAGATVGFSQAGAHPHNVVFTGTQPSCVQTEGASSGSVPPLPSQPASAAWSGTCTFTAATTYAFSCALHGGSGMTGTVTVTGTPPPPPPAPVVPPPPPPAGPAASKLTVAMRQRGTSVHGSVSVRSAGSRLLARAFARRGALVGGRSALEVQVGRRLRSSVGPGIVSFSVSLNATAARALRRNGRLAITLRLTVDPVTGTTFTAKRSVILRPR